MIPPPPASDLPCDWSEASNLGRVPLLWHIFAILYYPVFNSHLLLAPDLWLHQLPSSWQCTNPGILFSFPRKTVTFPLLHVALVIFLPCWWKKVLPHPPFCRNHSLSNRGCLKEPPLSPATPLRLNCKTYPSRQGNTSTAQWRVFSQGKIPDMVTTWFKKCSFNCFWVVQIARQLLWMSFLDLLCFSEAMAKENVACILPTCDEHCWLYVLWLFSWCSW